MNYMLSKMVNETRSVSAPDHSTSATITEPADSIAACINIPDIDNRTQDQALESGGVQYMCTQAMARPQNSCGKD